MVYSKGPIIRTLEFTSALAGLAAIVALIFSLTVFSDRIDLIQQSRQRSATDTCYLFRAAVHAASKPNGVQAGNDFLRNIGLGDCVRYGKDITSLKHVGN